MHDQIRNATFFFRLPSYPFGKPTERPSLPSLWRVPQRSPSARYPRPTHLHQTIPLTRSITFAIGFQSSGPAADQPRDQREPQLTVQRLHKQRYKRAKADIPSWLALRKARRIARSLVSGTRVGRASFSKSNAVPFPTISNKEALSRLPSSRSALAASMQLVRSAVQKRSLDA